MPPTNAQSSIICVTCEAATPVNPTFHVGLRLLLRGMRRRAARAPAHTTIEVPTDSRPLREAVALRRSPYPAGMSTNAVGRLADPATVLDAHQRWRHASAIWRDVSANTGLTARAGLISETLATAHRARPRSRRVYRRGRSATGAHEPRTAHGRSQAARLRRVGSPARSRVVCAPTCRSTIAHEMRTPLTAIRTCASLLSLAEDAHPTAEQHRTLVETIERNAERMQRVVGDILDLARFRVRRHQPPATPVRRHSHGGGGRPIDRPVAVRARRRVWKRPRPRRGDLGVRRPPPSRAGAPQPRLERSYASLPAGGHVTVTRGCRPVRRVSGPSAIDGPGIAADDQSSAVRAVLRRPRNAHRAGDGVGLGLPTALAIAQAHGGTHRRRERTGVAAAHSRSSYRSTALATISSPADARPRRRRRTRRRSSRFGSASRSSGGRSTSSAPGPASPPRPRRTGAP